MKCPNCFTDNYKDAVKSKKVQAAFIATTPEAQIIISKLYLKNNISLILEKPVSLNLNNIKKIIELNNKYKKLILINYIYLYHPLILFLKEFFSKNNEKVKYIKTSGGDNNPQRFFISTLFDWGPHDLSILLFFISYPTLSKFSVSRKYRRINYKLYFKSNENFISTTYFGNNFKFKKRIVKIYTNKNYYEIDLVKNILLKKDKKILNFKIKSTPLQNILNFFHKNFKNKKLYNRDLNTSIKLTEILLKVEEKNV